MDKPRLPKCPICRQPVRLRAENPYFPFCSEHCQMVDLGRWINEEYRLPVSDEETERSLPSDTTTLDD
jgi:endogenous inhibitor of DNA gyrase (YacG/DUF329 family)